ncbi:MAG: PIG-L family deacetylase [Desulfobacca sp.]|nr:PIG-L family deacetylase [Desulfobacca sp.]
MAVAAHPDDLEFSCAGTLALWTKKMTKVVYLICTSGEAGFDQPNLGREERMGIREEEQRAAAAVLGVQEVVFLREPDGLLQPTLELRRKIVREIRRIQPDVVMCWDPSVLWINNSMVNHPDHRAAAQATVDAVFPSSGLLYLHEDLNNEGLVPWQPDHLFVFSFIGDETVLDITETIDLKIAALKKHQSQIQGWDPEPFIRDLADREGRPRGIQYAESFKIIQLKKPLS